MTNSFGKTINGKTYFFDNLALDPSLHFPEAWSLDQQQSLSKILKELEQDHRPLEFASPLYSPLTPKTITVVHPSKNNPIGGFQGDTRKFADGKPKPHGGIDIDAEPGQGVLAAEDGVVVRAEYSKNYGNVVYVNHRGGYQTRYAHLTDFNVKIGDKIKRGELIGTSGKTGNANSPNIQPHVHFEIRKKMPNGESTSIDPLPYLLKQQKFDETVHLNFSGIKI